MVRIIFLALVVLIAVCLVYFLMNRINWRRSIPYAFLFLPVGMVAYYLDHMHTAIIASVAGLGFLVYGLLFEDSDDGSNEDAHKQE
ncbi:MAG: hypothetical protein ACR2O0_06740 [Rhizobiaceae bacterium]